MDPFLAPIEEFNAEELFPFLPDINTTDNDFVMDDTLFPQSPIRIQDPFLTSSVSDEDLDFDRVLQDNSDYVPKTEEERELMSETVSPFAVHVSPVPVPSPVREDDQEMTIEIADDHDYVAEKEEDKTEKSVLNKVQKKSRRAKRRKPKANAWSVGKKVEVKVVKANVGEERAKLYEQQPFHDAELERCRKNALSAKLNREKKKREQEMIQQELEELRRENAKLKEREELAQKRAKEAENKLKTLADLVSRSPLLPVELQRENRIEKKVKAEIALLGNDGFY